jgi:hypothetical protein
MDLEGIVSKRLGSRYVSGCNQWRRQERQRDTDFPWGARHAGIGQVASVRIREWRSAAGEDDQPDETNVIHHSRGTTIPIVMVVSVNPLERNHVHNLAAPRSKHY